MEDLLQTLDETQYYTVEKLANIKELGFKRSRISQLLKEANVKKIGNKYYVTKEQFIEIVSNNNNCIKPYMLRNLSLEEIL